jgi:hypothetical protein
MANPEHLEILKRGVKAWNQWREGNGTIPDLTNASLGGTESPIYLIRDEDILVNEQTIESFFQGANFRHAKMNGTNFKWSWLVFAKFIDANLEGAVFTKAELSGADFRNARLAGADLSGTMLTGVNFKDVDMRGANFGNAELNNCFFINTNLGAANGLDQATHYGPSEISLSTIFRSGGRIPEIFLRGCGVPDEFIIYMHSLAVSAQPIRFNSCFISYSSKDQDFADRLYADLQNKGVRCWFAPEDMKIGDTFRLRIDESIRIYDKLLLVLSENSVSSQWVESEVETAMERERENAHHRTVLFPVRLDDAVNDIRTGWPADVRRTRHIGDFTRWKDHDSYQKAFDRLLRDLKAEEQHG